jgi:hypothetical protein
MNRHPDSVLIRRMLCGPIGSAKLYELSPSAHNPASDLTETTSVSCLERARVGSPVDPTAPGTDIVCPPPVPGALINTPVHGETYAG